MVKASVERDPAEIATASEQIVLTPSAAPILMTFVFKILTAANVATPFTTVTGLEVALIPSETALVQVASENPVSVRAAVESVLIFKFASKTFRTG